MNEVQTTDRFSFTIFLAVAVHAIVIFGITFSQEKPKQAAPTLNITLATHKTHKAPEKADFLSQHNQEASGTEADVKELTTTELAETADVVVNKVNPTQEQLRTSSKKQQTELVVTKGHNTQKAPQQTHTESSNSSQAANDHINQEAARTQKLASLQAKLDLKRQQMAREPRITRHTSVSTKSSDEAEYYNRWSQKVVRIGNKNFPKEAINRKIFGNLRLSVKIRPDGSVANIEILESSGHSLLDEAALHIVRLSSPFDPFPPEIKKNTDIFEIIRTWKFEITGLSTSS